MWEERELDRLTVYRYQIEYNRAWVEVGSRRGVGCELHARPECSPCSRRSQRPLGVARRARIPKLPRVASRATPPVGAEEGLGARCDRFFGSACVTERSARRETCYYLRFVEDCQSAWWGQDCH